MLRGSHKLKLGRRLATGFRRASLPRTALFLLLLAAGLVLACLPAHWQGRLRSLVGEVLAPGQEFYLSLLPDRAEPSIASPPRDAASEAATAREIAQLQQQVAELQNAVLAAQRESELAAGAPLIEADWVTLRVLGRQARWRLPPRELLAAGAAIGIAREDLVAVTDDQRLAGQEPRWLDGGKDQHILPGLLAFHGAAIFGRIVAVGPHTSTVERVTDPGFRDLVRIRFAGSHQSADATHSRPGPQGVLEGIGAAWCRVRMIPASEPISVGDHVVSAGYEGLLTEPLRYGVIVKAECAVDAPHWEIWMAPDAYRERPRLVHVLRTKTVPEHLAGQLDEERR